VGTGWAGAYKFWLGNSRRDLIATHIAAAVLMGVGATLLLDLWSLLLKTAFHIPSLNYCLLGRWILHMPGKFMHASIGAAPGKAYECAIGWTTHYLIGIVFALLFVAVASDSWLRQPTVLPAVAFGVVTVLVPFLTMQPAFGLGIAASKTPHPSTARLKSVMTHAVFGCGLYLSGILVSRVLYHS
jgi:hypothetical protein